MLDLIGNQIYTTFNLIKKDWPHSLLSLMGLSVGLFGSLIIALVVIFDLSFDNWVTDNDKVYMLTASKNVPGRPSRFITSAPAVLIPQIESKLSGLERIATGFVGIVTVTKGVDKYILNSTFVNRDFFDIFNIKVLHGSLQDIDQAIDSIVLTESESMRLLGKTNSLGDVINLTSGRSLIVKAVINDWPKNSHYIHKSFISINAPEFQQRDVYLNNWGSTGGMIYLKFRERPELATTIRNLNQILSEAAPPHYGKPTQGNKAFYELSMSNISVASLLLAGERIIWGMSFSTLGLLLMGLIILLISTINFSISSSAQVTQRTREIMIRKILGADKIQIGIQFIIEACVFCISAYLFSLLLTFIILPGVEHTFRQDLSYALGMPIFYIIGFLVAVVVGVLSGLYPAFISIGQEINISETSRGSSSKLLVLKGFVAVQVFFSCAMLFITSVIVGQLHFISELDKGFDVKNNELIYIGDKSSNIDGFKLAVEKTPGVDLTGFMNTYPGSGQNNSSSVTSGYIDAVQNVDWINADEGALDALNVNLLHGRLFSAQRPIDDIATNTEGHISVLVTKSAVRLLGFESVKNALGQRFKLVYGGNFWREAEVIGVLDDLKLNSARSSAQPMVIVKDSNKFDYLLAKIQVGRQKEVKARINQLYKQNFNNQTALMVSLESHFNNMFYKQKQQGKFTASTSVLAVLLTCVGIMALSSLLLNRDVKNLMIRKVIGASDQSLVLLVVSRFLLPLVVGIALSIPLAQWLAQIWLDSFVYQTSLGLLNYIIPITVVTLIIVLVALKHYMFIRQLEPASVLHYE